MESYGYAAYAGHVAGIALPRGNAEYGDCRTCGKTVNVNALRGGICHACRVENGVEPAPAAPRRVRR